MISSGDCKVILGGVGGVVKVLDGRTLTLLQSYSLLDSVAVPKGGQSRPSTFYSRSLVLINVCMYVCRSTYLGPKAAICERGPISHTASASRCSQEQAAGRSLCGLGINRPHIHKYIHTFSRAEQGNPARPVLRGILYPEFTKLLYPRTLRRSRADLG